MVLRVTFDTNVLDLACRPERSPKHPRQPNLSKVKEALIAGSIEGFYPVTMLTIEGIMRKDRTDVYSGTEIKHVSEVSTAVKSTDYSDNSRAKTDKIDAIAIESVLSVHQPNRKPLHREVIARVNAAHALGFRVLKGVPRLGSFQIDDPNGEYYLSNGEGEFLGTWLSKIFEVCRAIESRGLGQEQVKNLGKSIAGPQELWYEALKNAKDIHAEREIERAFSEWADADAIASHVAYGLDIFCSNDVGNSNVKNSILHPHNRAWLTSTYGIRFMTFDELLDECSGAGEPLV